MLELRGVTKRFGRVTAVDGLSIDVPDGQMVGVIGRSGAGKSTLLRMINRLHEPSAGSVTFRGIDVTGIKGAALHDWRARCAMIFQQFNLVDRLDVLTNVLIGRLGHRPTLPTLFKLFSADERAAALLALDRLDMAPQALQRADTLSGGQQQRVAIARALIQQPDIVLADEPIASLDPRNATRVMEGLRTIHEESGITVICNLHQVEAAKNFCDRIVGMANGRLVFDGTPADLSMDAVREIYGATASDGEFDDAVGTTDLPPIGRRIPAEAAALA